MPGDAARKLVAALLTTALLLAGCSEHTVSLPAPQLNGVVQSGGTASTHGLANARVRLYEAGDGPARLMGTATSNQSGNFAITMPDTSAAAVRYMTASLDGGIEFVAVLGESVPDSSVLIGDPGGDGMVIFVGLAAPTQPGRTQ